MTTDYKREVAERLTASGLNYKEDINIDPDALDTEWLAQPGLFMKYSEALVEAKDEADRLERSLSVFRARTQMDIRNKPASYGITSEKPTEGNIQSALLQVPGYQALEEDIGAAQYRSRLLEAAVNAMDMKRRALERLVILHGQNYFAGPTEPRNLGMEWGKNAHHKAASDKIRERLNPESTTPVRRRRGD